MIPKFDLKNSRRGQFKNVLAVAVIVFFLCLTAPAAAAAGVVNPFTDAGLRAAISGGGTVTFPHNGTIILSNVIPVVSNTALNGSGHQITLSGNNSVRLLYVSTNVSFQIINLTIANGEATNGAGVFNDGGTLALSGVVFENNVAQTLASGSVSGAPSEGGALFNRGGTINATNCIFTNNLATVPSGNYYSIESHGGAIRDESGAVNLQNCSFTGNQALGGSVASYATEPGAVGAGGAIHNSGTLNASGCNFTNNYATGGRGSLGGYLNLEPGTPGGAGEGAAIFNSGVAAIEGGAFVGNSAAGGGGGGGGDSTTGGGGGSGGSGSGGAIFNFGSLLVQGSAMANNSAVGAMGGHGAAGGTSPGGYGGAGGSGFGGAIYNDGAPASLVLQCSAIISNTCTGGAGGGAGYGGGTPYPDGTEGCAGGNGGNGGQGDGGGLFNSDGGTGSLVNCTLAFNGGSGSSGGTGGTGGNSTVAVSNGGTGGNGGNGGSGVGGIYDGDGLVKLTNCTVAFNYGVPGIAGGGGQGGSGSPAEPPLPPGAPGNPGATGTPGSATGGLSASGTWLINTVLDCNAGTNCSGFITDLGHNLSSDGSCAFTDAGSINNTDPKLGPLANNGGPTLTMALLPTSPAIDAGDNAAATPTDQRGFPRVVGPAIDIGAYELCYLPVLRISQAQTGAVNILVYALPNQTCRLLSSSTLADWEPIATNQIGATGTNVFQAICDPGQLCGVFRVCVIAP